MATSHYLVQWMPGPCTEAGPDREFSLISLDDVKEDYRYALECGRITMATYRFGAGTDCGSMHRLCKILALGEKTMLERELLTFVGGRRSEPGGEGTAQGTGEDEITIIKVEEVEEPSAMSVDQGSPAEDSAKYPSWEMQQEITALLKENHQIQRENGLLRKKLAKAVDVMDLRNILETTIVNIKEKQIRQLTQPQTAHEPDEEAIDFEALASELSEDSTLVHASPVNIISTQSVLSGIESPTTSGHTLPTTTVYRQLPKPVQTQHTARQQPRSHVPTLENATFQHQARPAQEHLRELFSQQQQLTDSRQTMGQQVAQGPIQLQQSAETGHAIVQQVRQGPVQLQQSAETGHAIVQQVRQSPVQLQQSPDTGHAIVQQVRHSPIQLQQSPDTGHAIVQQVRQGPMQLQQPTETGQSTVQIQQQQTRPTVMHHQQASQLPAQHQHLQQQQQLQQLQQQQQQREQHGNMGPVSTQPQQHSDQMQSEDPYVVYVQSLNKQVANPAGHALSTGIDVDEPGPSGTARMGTYARTLQGTQVPTGTQHRTGFKRPHGRRRATHWGSGHATEDMLHLQRVRDRQRIDPPVSSAAEIPSTSTQHSPPVNPQGMSARLMKDEDDSEMMVELAPGTGVKLDRRHLRIAQRSKTYSQYTRNLMTLVFTTKELSVCSVTGATARKKGNPIVRPALDQTKVKALIASVSKKFPSVSHSEVKQIMAQKMLEIRYKLTHRRRIPAWKRSGTFPKLPSV